ncbi:MAG: co-chaperone GroES [Culicoidibacterales bacterium]
MMKPLYDRVIVEVAQVEKKTASGIVLPDTAKEETPTMATVIAVGEGRVLDDGKRLPVAVKEGQKVIFSKYAGVEVEYEGATYLILNEKDIVAVVE